MPEPAIQYADFARWQRERLTGPFLDRPLQHWTARLAEVPPLDLPTDHPPPRDPARMRGGGLKTLRNLEVLERGDQPTSAAEGATPFMTFLAAFQVLLQRYSGQDDFAVGSPIANRNRAETEDLIGVFVNTLALRADLSGNPSFRDLLALTRETALAAFEHQDMPFVSGIVEAPEPVRRDPSRTPLFQVMFVLQNNEAVSSCAATISVTIALASPGEGTGTAVFRRASWAWKNRPKGSAGSFEYNADLFDGATIEPLGRGSFSTLLGSIVAGPVAAPFGSSRSCRPRSFDHVTRAWSSQEPGAEIGLGRAACTKCSSGQVERTPATAALHRRRRS